MPHFFVIKFLSQCQSYISKGIWRQGIGSFVRNCNISTPSPVFMCPYLCTSDSGLECYFRFLIKGLVARSSATMLSGHLFGHTSWTAADALLRSISEISSCFFGPRPWHTEIRHRVKKTSTINLFGFETLKLKIRRLKLWKPTVQPTCECKLWAYHAGFPHRHDTIYQAGWD